jgi:hypothetical protein
MRKGLVYGVVFAACGGWFSAADAAYVITLKNGNEYVTARYWQEGGQVLFDTYGGIFGIEKAFVGKIESSDRIVPSPVATSAKEQPIGTAPRSLASSPERQSTQGEGKALQPEKAAPAPAEAKEPLKKDEDILKEYGELKKRFGQINDLPKHEVRGLDADMESFRKKLASSSKAEAHQQELDTVATLQRAIAGYLKANE